MKCASFTPTLLFSSFLLLINFHHAVVGCDLVLFVDNKILKSNIIVCSENKNNPIDITDEFSSFEAGVLQNLGTITDVVLNKFTGDTIPADLFSGTQITNKLHITGVSTASSIPIGLFNPISSVADLKLQLPGLQALPENVFLPLTSLVKLELICTINSVHAGAFAGLSSLSNLILSQNSIASLDANTFTSCKNTLKKLTINDNQIVNPNAVLSQLTALTELNLNGNLIVDLEISNLSSLQILDCKNNELASIKASNLPTAIEQLDISYNKLSIIPPMTFENMSNLKKLHVNNNIITILNKDVFKGAALTELAFANNPISAVEPGTFELVVGGISAKSSTFQNAFTTMNLDCCLIGGVMQFESLYNVINYKCQQNDVTYNLLSVDAKVQFTTTFSCSCDRNEGLFLAETDVSCFPCSDQDACSVNEKQCLESRNVTTCNTCENTHYSDGGLCRVCTEQALCSVHNDVCLPSNEKSCTTCNSGYFVSPVTGQCTMCTMPGRCTLADKTCTENNVLVCTQCSAGYVVYNGVCVVEGCETNQYDSEGNCVDCSEPENCKVLGNTCDNENVQLCFTCNQPDYILYQGKCTLVEDLRNLPNVPILPCVLCDRDEGQDGNFTEEVKGSSASYIGFSYFCVVNLITAAISIGI